VTAIPGLQQGATAIRCDDDGIVVDYGMIHGHRHAGLGIVDRDQLNAAREWLGRNRTEWYPGLYTTVKTGMVAIPPDHQVEINRPRDKVAALSKLPLGTTEGLDLHT
jgi:hypothetical protein